MAREFKFEFGAKQGRAGQSAVKLDRQRPVASSDSADVHADGPYMASAATAATPNSAATASIACCAILRST